MDRESISAQFKIEHGLINKILGSLRMAIDWKTGEVGTTRKLSTIRFVADSFHRHLERLMAIHEYDGYMSEIVEVQPQLQSVVEEPKLKQDQLRHELNRIVSHLERLSPSNSSAFQGVCDSLLSLLAMYEDHAQKETRLVQEAFTQELGGES